MLQKVSNQKTIVQLDNGGNGHQEASGDADSELGVTQGEEELRIPVATQEDGSITSTAVLRCLGALQHPLEWILLFRFRNIHTMSF